MAERQLRLLSLDGGGVRGLASLYMLRQLLSHFGDEKPCNFFDMIAGTSTGGLIAIMLGCLEMSVDQCIEAFTALMGTIFKREHRIPFSLRSGKIQPLYNTKELEDAIKHMIQCHGLPADVLMRSSHEPNCRTFVTATSGYAKETVHFTNYRKTGEQSDFYDKVKLWEAARATSAATTFFEPMRIDESIFWDGALGANNPVDSLWKEARLAFGPDPLESQIRCVLSVGTGKPALKAFGENLVEVGKSLVAIATETEKTAGKFYENHEELANRDGYFRFNPPDLDEVGLDEGQKRALIRERTEAYGNEFRERMFVRRFQEVAGKEPKQVLETASIGPSPLRIFYTLHANPEHVRPGMKSYWHRLTLPAYKIYERIALDCKHRSKHPNGKVYFLAFLQTFNLNSPSPRKVADVWARLLKDKSDIQNSRHPVSFVMATIYMLHLEKHDSTQKPDDLDDVEGDRREALKRYDRWIPCICKRRCGKEWNFINDIGLSRGGEANRCDVEKWLVSGDLRNALFAKKDKGILEAMREKWRTPRHKD